MATFPLTLDTREQAYRVGLLGSDLAETRVEVRHTDTPALRKIPGNDELVTTALRKNPSQSSPEHRANRPIVSS